MNDIEKELNAAWSAMQNDSAERRMPLLFQFYLVKAVITVLSQIVIEIRVLRERD